MVARIGSIGALRLRPAPPVMGLTKWLLLLLLSGLWGGSFLFVELALAALPPLTIVLARVALAAPALLLLVRLQGEALPRSPRLWAGLVALGALNNAVPFGLIAFGQTATTAGLAAILIAATPLFTVLLAHLLTADERLSAHRLAGVALGLGGGASWWSARTCWAASARPC
jgi:drug/metabolite transporter (DMT)-like permease